VESVSGHDRPGPGWTPDEEVDCDLDFPTHLTNPDPVEVAGLSVGDRLVVDLDESGPSIRALREGRRVGAITSHVPVLVRCILKGYQYEAIVDGIDGGDVAVTIRNL
jgi:hypothetical protein